MTVLAIGSAGACGYWLSQWHDSAQMAFIEKSCTDDKMEQRSYFNRMGEERDKRIDTLTNLVSAQTQLLEALKRSTDTNTVQARTAAHAAQKAVEAVSKKTAPVVIAPASEVIRVEPPAPKSPFTKQR
jgi:hypothetical protein